MQALERLQSFAAEFAAGHCFGNRKSLTSRGIALRCATTTGNGKAGEALGDIGALLWVTFSTALGGIGACAFGNAKVLALLEGCKNGGM